MSPSTVEELQVYQRAAAAADAVFALTEGPAFNRDPELRQQMRSSSGRITSHLQEGSGQLTDRHYAHYVGIARGSSKEMKAHLRRALGYRFITDAEYQTHWKTFDELAAMLTGLIKHLEKKDRKRRG